MISNEFIHWAWLWWLSRLAEYWQTKDTRSFYRDRAGLLCQEKAEAAKEGWVKPEVREWYKIDYEEYGIAPTQPPLTLNQRNQFTRYLTGTLEANGLVEITRANNGRILWVRLTETGKAEAMKPDPYLADE